MKLRGKMLLRVLLAAVLVAVAGLAAVLIKDAMAQRNPESALPVIYVDYEGRGLPAKHVMMDSYEWRFLNKTIHWEVEDRDAWKSMEAAPVLPSSPLELRFSFPANSVVIYRETDGDGGYEEVLGNLETPARPGNYTYKVRAGWGRGVVWFYFRLLVVSSY